MKKGAHRYTMAILSHALLTVQNNELSGVPTRRKDLMTLGVNWRFADALSRCGFFLEGGKVRPMIHHLTPEHWHRLGQAYGKIQ